MISVSTIGEYHWCLYAEIEMPVIGVNDGERCYQRLAERCGGKTTGVLDHNDDGDDL